MADAAITVTLKSGKGYEAHWAVFKGDSATEVREQVIDYFLLEVDESLSLHEVVLTAENVLQGTSNIAKGLGARPVKAEKTPAPAEANVNAGEEPAEPTESPEEALVAKMEAAEDTTALRRLWVDNKDVAAGSEVVKAAYKARGQKLKDG